MNLRDFVVFKLGKLIPDRIWIQMKYYKAFGRFCDMKNPKTYNEKLQWLKLNNRRPEYSVMVDKFEMKRFVSERIGTEYVIPSIGGPWNTVEEIELGSLPEQFVLKTTHDCGGVVICKDKSKFDFNTACEFLNKHLHNNYYLAHREWPYKNVRPRIFAEQYMEDESGYGLRDYKWFCFDGEPKALYVASERSNENTETKFDFFDAEFNHLPIINGHPNSDFHIERPKGFEKMKKLAAKLSKGYPHLRVDFYDINGNIYVGELTFFHWSGLVPFEPEEWDLMFGSWITLPNSI